MLKSVAKVLLLYAFASAAVCGDEFVETFGGDGLFVASNGITGFENDHWLLEAHESRLDQPWRFVDGGLFEVDISTAPKVDAKGAFLSFDRQLKGKRSFREHVILRNLQFDEKPLAAAVHFVHRLGDGRLRMSIVPRSAFDYILIVESGEENHVFPTHLGSDLSMTLEFDQATRESNFVFDSDLDDNLAPILLGPFPYERDISLFQQTELTFSVGQTDRISSAIDFWSLATSGGDYDQNGLIDVRDIDLLTVALNSNTDVSAEFDLDASGTIDNVDHRVWAEEIAETQFGDANLNGAFDSSDLVLAFQAGEYEDDTNANSTWADGDWNGDLEFTSRDLVFVFSNSDYESMVVGKVAPETTNRSVCAVIVLLVFAGRKFRKVERPRRYE